MSNFNIVEQRVARLEGKTEGLDTYFPALLNQFERIEQIGQWERLGLIASILILAITIAVT